MVASVIQQYKEGREEELSEVAEIEDCEESEGTEDGTEDASLLSEEIEGSLPIEEIEETEAMDAREDSL